jgi:lipopolysaccharide exporter
MVALRLLERTIRIVSIAILARLLVPGDFGLLAIATAIITVVELISTFDFDVALIQKQDATRAHYDTAWTLNIIMAAACALLVAAAAFPAGVFYSEARLGPIMLWLALATWIRGFENIGVVAFRKELQLHREFQLLLTKRIGVFLVTISVALATRSYWALVFGSLTGGLMTVILSYLLHPFRPRFDLSARGDLLRFSKWLVLSNVINTVSNRSADLVIGKSLGPAPLGLFSLADEISNLPTTELSAPINRATFPGYARVASDPAQLRAHFLEVQGWTALLTVPAAIGIAAIAPMLVPLLLGDAWRGAIPLMKILAFAGLLASWRTNTGYVLLAVGRSGLVTVMIAVKFIVLVPALVVGTIYFGAEGAAWAMLATSVVMLPVAHGFVIPILRARSKDYLRILWRPALATAAMAFLLAQYLEWSQHAFPAQATVWLLASTVVLGVLIYTASIGLLWAVSGFPDSAEARILKVILRTLGRMRAGARIDSDGV